MINWTIENSQKASKISSTARRVIWKKLKWVCPFVAGQRNIVKGRVYWNFFFVKMMVCVRNTVSWSMNYLGRGGKSEEVHPKVRIFCPRLKRESHEMKWACVLGCLLARGKTHADINDDSEQLLEIRFFPGKISANKIVSWQNISQLDFFMVEIQPIRRFGHRQLSNQGFQVGSSACQMFSVFGSRSIKSFQARSPADPMIYQ